MKELAVFFVGFTAGWGLRAFFDSRRDALVSLAAAGYRAAESARRHAGLEREYLEDLLSEGKARWEAEQRRRAAEAAARAEQAGSQREEACR